MLKRLFSRSDSAARQSVVIVSGLPRSGTSMMMKMLSEAGLPILMDGRREADDDNPNGYFEIELSKSLKDGGVRWVYEAQGKAVKVISYLLEYLPGDLRYDVIFMERDFREMLASQKKMLERRGESAGAADEEMEAQFRDHLKAVKYWITRQPNMRTLFLRYDQVVHDPAEACKVVSEFLSRPLDLQAMQSVPSEGLYRNR